MTDPTLPDGDRRHDADWVDEVGSLDSTLEDDVTSLPAAAEAKRFLMRQRFVHGLLRAMNGADAAGKEARVEAILEALPDVGRRARGSGTLSTPRLLLAAAAVVVGGWLLWAAVTGTSTLPTAERLLARAAEQLAVPVDRRFSLRIERLEPAVRERSLADAELVVRPGGSFRVDGAFGRLPIVLASDAEIVWWQIGDRRGDKPIAEAERLNEAFGDVLELGYFDITDLLDRVPASLELTSRERVRPDDGPVLVRVVGTKLPKRGLGGVESAELLVEEDSGMIVRFEVVLRGRLGLNAIRVQFGYEGEAAADPARYRRAW